MDFSYIIYYRTGGTENFKWHRVYGIFSYRDGGEKIKELNRMGYYAEYVESTQDKGAPTEYNGWHKWDDWAGVEGAYILQSEKMTTFGAYRYR